MKRHVPVLLQRDQLVHSVEKVHHARRLREKAPLSAIS